MVFEFKPLSYVSHETFPVSTSSKEEGDWGTEGRIRPWDVGKDSVPRKSFSCPPLQPHTCPVA